MQVSIEVTDTEVITILEVKPLDQTPESAKFVTSGDLKFSTECASSGVTIYIEDRPTTAQIMCIAFEVYKAPALRELMGDPAVNTALADAVLTLLTSEENKQEVKVTSTRAVGTIDVLPYADAPDCARQFNLGELCFAVRANASERILDLYIDTTDVTNAEFTHIACVSSMALYSLHSQQLEALLEALHKVFKLREQVTEPIESEPCEDDSDCDNAWFEPDEPACRKPTPPVRALGEYKEVASKRHSKRETASITSKWWTLQSPTCLTFPENTFVVTMEFLALAGVGENSALIDICYRHMAWHPGVTKENMMQPKVAKSFVEFVTVHFDPKHVRPQLEFSTCVPWDAWTLCPKSEIEKRHLQDCLVLDIPAKLVNDNYIVKVGVDYVAFHRKLRADMRPARYYRSLHEALNNKFGNRHPTGKRMPNTTVDAYDQYVFMAFGKDFV